MRRIATILTAFALSALMLPAVASAQYYGSTPMNESASGVTFVPSSETLDPTGSVIITTGVLDGALAGSPITGGLHIEEVRTRPVDSGAGSVTGQFTIADGFGGSIMGNMNGMFTIGPAGSNANGSFTVTGGTGPYTGASGSGSYSAAVSDPSLGGSSVTFSSAAISLGAAPGVVPVPVPAAAVAAPAATSNGLIVPAPIPATTYAQPYLAPGYDPYAAALSQQQAQALAAANAAAQAVVQQAQQPYIQPTLYSPGDWACMTAITQNQSCNNDDPTRTQTSSATNHNPRR